MRAETTERWPNLCAQAALVEDPGRLRELTSQIDRLLEEDELRLRQPRRMSFLSSTKTLTTFLRLKVFIAVR